MSKTEHKALIDRNSNTVGYWMIPMQRLAAAVIHLAYVDYMKGRSKVLQMDAYHFLKNEHCGIWRAFVQLAPGWDKDIKPIAGAQTALDEKMRHDIVDKYIEGFATMRGISMLFKRSYEEVQVLVRAALSAKKIRRIEETRRERQRVTAIRRILEGERVCAVAKSCHTLRANVLEWLEQFLLDKGLDDCEEFLQELRKKDRGNVGEQVKEWVKELACITWD